MRNIEGTARPSCLIVAHRGASGLTEQDNTLYSFRRAIELGCDWVELDVRKSRDGQLVCFHDEAVETAPIETLSLDALRQRSGVRVPTLAEILSLCRGKIRLDVEIKAPGFEAEVLDALRGQLAPDEFVVISFATEIVSRVAALDPQIDVGLLCGGPGPDETAADVLDRILPRIGASGAAFFAPHHSLVGPELFAHPAWRAWPVWVWTVNVPAEMRRLLRHPIRAIASDRPDYLAEVVGRRRAKMSRIAVKACIEECDHDGMIASLSGREIDGATLPTRQVRIARGILHELPDWVTALWGSQARGLLVLDENTRKACSSLVKRHAAEGVLELQPLRGWKQVTPHEPYVDSVVQASERYDALIAVGSGTINDIVKYAAHQAGKPYLVVATAPSMNGYTSSIASLVAGGLKRTLPCTPPAAVLADVDVLARAPAAMARSGYADLLSKMVAAADWKLGSAIVGGPFSDLPYRVAGSAIDSCVQEAAAISRRENDAIAALMRALILSGYSLTLAGSSAPASGGEHLISHYLDLAAYADVRKPALHGFQVGLGMLLTAKLYEVLRKQDPEDFVPIVTDPARLPAIHGKLWPGIESEARKQILTLEQAAARVAKIRASWDGLWPQLDPYLATAAEVRADLLRAGVPVSPEDLGLTRAGVKTALLHAADLRARYTVLHLARDVGVFPAAAEEVLEVLGS